MHACRTQRPSSAGADAAVEVAQHGVVHPAPPEQLRAPQRQRRGRAAGAAALAQLRHAQVAALRARPAKDPLIIIRSPLTSSAQGLAYISLSGVLGLLVPARATQGTASGPHAWSMTGNCGGLGLHAGEHGAWQRKRAWLATRALMKSTGDWAKAT